VGLAATHTAGDLLIISSPVWLTPIIGAFRRPAGKRVNRASRHIVQRGADP